MVNAPPLLTADEAREESEHCLGRNYWALEAIATGRTVVVPTEELAHLRAEVEKYRGGMHTHGPDCWSWGWRHYECAEMEIARLRARVAELESCEPVAWRWRDKRTTFYPEWALSHKRTADYGHPDNEQHPLYAAAPPVQVKGEAFACPRLGYFESPAARQDEGKGKG